MNCYTIVERNILPKGEIYPYKNHEIIGFWIYKAPQIDGTERIKKLEFFEDGTVTFYPDAEYLNSKYISGKFSIKNDTLNIKLNNNSPKEVFIYYIEDSTLVLNKIKSNNRTGFQIQGNGEASWHKVNF
jgi:restriction endonuclease S subunit